MATTPDDVTYQSDQTTTGVNDMTSSSSSRGIAFYYEIAVVFVGVVGTAANALILYAMVVSKQHRKQMLIFNQNVLDLVSSIFLVITYGAKLCSIPLSASTGYWLCMWLLSENILWCPILAAKLSLMLVTVERYLKVVHRALSKKMLRKWVIYSVVAFSWIAGFALSIGITLSTTDLVDGVCLSYVFWSSRASQLAYGIFYFTFFYGVILLTFVFCYGRILTMIRGQARTMAAHSTTVSSQQSQTSRAQTSIIKTMVLVSAFYAVSEMPMQVYYLLLNVNTNMTIIESGYYVSLFVSFLYICTNPFIYAAKFDPVKRVLLSLIPCRKTFDEQQTEGPTGTGTAP